VALLLLLVFTLLRGVLLGVTTPPFWGPDEDYHFLYADHLVTQHALIDPDRPLYTREYQAIERVVDYDSYCCRKTHRFEGDPKASVRKLAELGDDAREPTEVGRGVGVVHPPLYHVAAAAMDWTLGDASILTRATWLRFLTAAFGGLAVYAAWLLAAQVFASQRLQLLAAFLMAVQPQIAYLAGIINHDSALIAFSTLALAMLAFILRSPPRPAQGAWLAAGLVPALLVKGSALALVPLAPVAYCAQALTWPEHRRDVLRSAGVAFGLVLLLAGPWYLRAALVYESATGATTPLTGSGSGEAASLGNLFSWAKEWIGLTYRTYWWHYNFPETPGASVSKFIPALFGALGALGLLRLAWLQRRSMFDRTSAVLRQSTLLVLAVLAFWIPFMIVDLIRRTNGQPFFATGGRYLLPAFAGVAVLLLLGIGQLVRQEAERLVLWTIGASALVFGGFVYLKYSLDHYIGTEDPGDILRRMTFDRAPVVTQGFIVFVVVAAFAALVGFVIMTVRSERPEEGMSHYSEAA
jgi:4-amino-4-deoxy-L-arabinose transferase-like glycosyltransferase